MRIEATKLSFLCASSIAAASFAVIPASHAALLDGTTMSVVLSHRTNLEEPPVFVGSSFVVGPGVELTGFGYNEQPPLPPLVDMDVSDRQILITAVMDQPFAVVEELEFRSAPLIPFLIVNPATTWAGFTQDRAFTNREFFTIDLSQLTALAGQQILIDVIPEPASAGLALFACLATAAVRRRAR